MMSGEFLTVLRERGRRKDGVEARPLFVFFGDFHQLPPVSTEESPATFAFESEAWRDIFRGRPLVLRAIVRQTDAAFASLLQRVRAGAPEERDVLALRARLLPRGSEVRIDAPHVVPKRRMADEINARRLADIVDQPVPRSFRDFEDSLVGLWMAPMPGRAALQLKRGARVMLLVNDESEGYVNGDMGTVVSIDPCEHCARFENRCPLVLFEGRSHPFRVHYRMEFAPPKNPRGDRRDVPRRWYMPLQLAWACTVHKMQGMTFDRAVVDAGQETFADGQAYVVLSRVRTLEGLHLTALDPGAIRADPKVARFYRSYERRPPTDRDAVEGERRRAPTEREMVELCEELDGREGPSKRGIDGDGVVEGGVKRRRIDH